MQRMLDSKSGSSGTCGSSACMVNHKMVQAEKQAKNMSIWSINNKKTLFLHSSVGVCRWGKEMWTVSPQKELHSFCRKTFSPRHSTIHQWLLQSYWAFTRHLHIPDKRNKKHFKATLPTVPTLFHLSNAYKTVAEGQMLLRGATAHLLPASTLLKTLLLFILDNTP